MRRGLPQAAQFDIQQCPRLRGSAQDGGDVAAIDRRDIGGGL
jgi:hypothetical protein